FSVVLIVAGAIVLSVFRLNLGIDFTSGTRADIQTNGEAPAEEVEEELAAMDMQPESITTAGEGTVVARYSNDLSQEQVTEMQSTFDEMYGEQPMISTVSPAIGQELVRNAIYALAIASAAIILYATIRFEWRMALP